MKKKEEISPLCIKKEKSLLREKKMKEKKIENFKNKSRTITTKKEKKSVHPPRKKNKTKNLLTNR